MTKEFIEEIKHKLYHDYSWTSTKIDELDLLIADVIEVTEQQLILSGVGSSGSEFEKDLFKLINNYCKNGLKKPELVKKMEWVLGSCKMS